MLEVTMLNDNLIIIFFVIKLKGNKNVMYLHEMIAE